MIVFACLVWLGRMLGRALRRALLGDATRRTGAAGGVGNSPAEPRETYEDLTKQKITDADFEEISEE